MLRLVRIEDTENERVDLEAAPHGVSTPPATSAMEPPKMELTDENVIAMLPPYPLARATYRTYREQGASPSEALVTLLQEWAHFRHVRVA